MLVVSFMGQASGQVFFEERMSWDIETFFIILRRIAVDIARIVIIQNFYQSIGLILCSAIVVDVRVKETGDFELWHFHLHKAVILNGFRNAGSGKDGVEFSIVAKVQPVFPDIPDYRLFVGVGAILAIGQIVLDALYLFPISAFFTIHFYLARVHVLIVHFCFFRVCQCFFLCCRFRFF